MSLEVEKGVIECVAKSTAKNESEIKKESLLFSDFNLDSLDMIDIMFHLEEKFSIKLSKDDFNFLTKIGMSREEAVIDGNLTTPALSKLKGWIPQLDTDAVLRPSDLSRYVSVESVIILVSKNLGK